MSQAVLGKHEAAGSVSLGETAFLHQRLEMSSCSLHRAKVKGFLDLSNGGGVTR